eukprot:CAMPEP_0113934366 /NCGR_PEP_ID=MMETSP1339-20121228/1699_1 /TAXON_ID=94617 /ORGANISM="Fibrocapsa japonica" /LENGTH=165 /DNA_ID=CAMNT_0000936145 /DNA_START=73 /DNA_END=570 /DNA_ORIENTATION=- /assembly_acc=CAM_ASM_000762
MLSRAARSTFAGAFRQAAVRAFATEGSAALKLNFCLPHKSLYVDQEVASVIIPGLEGEYGVTAGHSAVLSQLKPGVVKVELAEGKGIESYFVSGGFALTHENSVTDVTAVEAVKVEDLDENSVKAAYENSKKEFDSATEGSLEKAEAQVGMEVAKAMAAAVGASV